jgi:hypothetical protein
MRQECRCLALHWQCRPSTGPRTPGSTATASHPEHGHMVWPSATVRSGDGDRLLGLGHEGSAGEPQLPGHHPRRRLGVGSPLRCAEPMVEERRAQRAVDTLQAVVLSSRPGDCLGRHRGALSSAKPHLHRGRRQDPQLLDATHVPIVQRRFSGAVISAPVGRSGRGRSPHNRAALHARRALSTAGIRWHCVSKRALQLANRPAWDAERPGPPPRRGRHRAPLAAPALGSYRPLAWTRATCGSAGSTTPARK